VASPATRTLVLILALLVTGCAAPKPPPAEPDPVELAEFRAQMIVFAHKAGEYLEVTRRNKNLSELTVGWFVFDVLTVLSSEDDVLYAYFNSHDRDLQTYLETEFRFHSETEMIVMERLALRGNPTRCLAAKFALEALRHVPHSADPAAIQLVDRRALAAALAGLHELLTAAAQEIEVADVH